MGKVKITVVGSANIDFIMQVPRLPALGETVVNGTFFQAFGGKGANQAVAAARAGGKVTFVAALGNDPQADAYRKSLVADGMDTTFLTEETDVSSGAALIMFDEKGDNYLTVAPGANSRVTPQRIRDAESAITDCDWIILQQEIPQDSNREVLRLARKHAKPVLLNYAPAMDLSLELDSSVTGLVVNEVEAASLAAKSFDAENPAAAKALAMDLRAKGGHQFVVITLGRYGSVYADKDGPSDGELFSVKSVDTTAAGDTFCGALTVALAEGKPLADAARFASAASALAVTRVGAQSSIPSRPEIEKVL